MKPSPMMILAIIIKNLNKIKLSRDYPEDPELRYSKDPGAVDDIGANMDAAIQEPVFILEDVLGYAAFASCEGHEKQNPYVKPPRKSKKYTIAEGPSYSSYIAFYMPTDECIPFIDFLFKKGFKNYPFYIIRGKIRDNDANNPCIIKKYYNTLLLARVAGFIDDDDEAQISIYVEPINYPESQQKWDKMRDHALERWLNLINIYQNGDYGYSPDYRDYHMNKLMEFIEMDLNSS